MGVDVFGFVVVDLFWIMSYYLGFELGLLFWLLSVGVCLGFVGFMDVVWVEFFGRFGVGFGRMFVGLFTWFGFAICCWVLGIVCVGWLRVLLFGCLLWVWWFWWMVFFLYSYMLMVIT